MLKSLKLMLAAAFVLTAIPLVESFAGGGGAEARPSCGPKCKANQSKSRKQGKYKYQYIPNSNGRTGGWR